MPNVIKKHSISFELAKKMVDAAVAKAKELGVSENVAILDDPLQSLDDINLLGLLDLLRRTKDSRQLLVSTHSERLGNLIARKLRPSNSEQRTTVIELSGWSREGPTVKQRDVKADPAPLRLAAV